MVTCTHDKWHDTHHAGRLCDDCDAELCTLCSKAECEHTLEDVKEAAVQREAQHVARDRDLRCTCSRPGGKHAYNCHLQLGRSKKPARKTSAQLAFEYLAALREEEAQLPPGTAPAGDALVWRARYDVVRAKVLEEAARKLEESAALCKKEAESCRESDCLAWARDEEAKASCLLKEAAALRLLGGK